MKITRNWDEWEKGVRIDEGHKQGRWEILNVLQGGMGRVYIVFDHRLQRSLAMKGLLREMWEFDRGDVQARFEKEALAWVKVDPHPNVVQALFVKSLSVVHRYSAAHPNAGKTVGGLHIPFLFLEYVEGGDLAKWIGLALSCDLARVLLFAIQFCDGMQHILGSGIVAHRDIKPANCLMTKEGVLKVTDFGLAKAFDNHVPRGDMPLASHTRPIDETLQSNLSRTGDAIGTLPYMAPEQLVDAKHVDVTADIYSFGVMLFQLVSGRLPFVGSTVREYHRLHSTQPPPPLQVYGNVSSKVVKGLNDIVTGCLAKRARDRIGNFGILRQRLSNLHLELIGREEAVPQAIRGPDPVAIADRAAKLIQLKRPAAEVMRVFAEALCITESNDYVWLKKGDAHVRFEQREKALECFDKALKLNPANVDAWVSKGRLLAHYDRQQEALECFEQALQLNPRHRAAYEGKGWALAGLGRRIDALAHIERALRLNPAHKNLGACVQILASHHNAGDDGCPSPLYQAFLQPGKTFYRKPSDYVIPGIDVTSDALLDDEVSVDTPITDDALLPEKVDATAEECRQRGLEAGCQGRWVEAGAWFERVLEVHHQLWVFWGLHGSALIASARPEGALVSFETALRINDSSEHTWSGKAEALQMLRRYEEALAAIERALLLNPRSDSILVIKATTLGELGRDAEALSSFDTALSINPKSEDGWRKKAVLLTKLGRHAEALAVYETLIPINPSNGWFNKGIFLLQTLGRPADALPCFEQAKKLGQPDADLAIRSCQAALKAQAQPSVAGAHEHAFSATMDTSPAVEALMSKGGTAMERQRFEEAVQFLNQALALNPQNAEAWYRHGIASLVLRRHAEGVTSLEKAQQLNHVEAAQHLLYWKQKIGMYKSSSQDSGQKADACASSRLCSFQLKDPVDFFLLNNVVLKACHPDAAERYRSAREMHCDLEQLQRMLRLPPSERV